ncbi:MAG: penicillin-binding protein 2 [Planctomycetes bacterium]|nr:penicillin-binding protein 2 [Planctomycetota bacterium]
MAALGGHNARVWAVALFVAALYAGLLGRLYLIQGMEESRFQEIARSQHFVRVPRSERRGSIVDCRGRALATSVQVPSIYADPRLVENPEATARRLADILRLDAALLHSRLVRPTGRVCLKRFLSDAEEAALREEPAVRELGTALEFRDCGLYAKPVEIRDPQAAAAALAPLLDLDQEELATDLDGLRRFVWVKRKVSDEEAKRVAAADIAGVAAWPEYKRTYPQGELGCQLVGFSGLDEQGLEGLEMAWNGLLSPDAGRAELQRDAAGRCISTPNAAAKPAQSGTDLELTIDTVVQGYAEDALHDLMDLWAPKGAFAVVLDPRTGDVLAAASLPTYDPNTPGKYESRDLKQRARARYIVDWMEPGSIMKAFIFSAALAERVVTEETPIFCENGMWLIGSRRFHDVHAYGTLDAAHVIIKSSNIGTAKIGKLLGPDRIHKYLRKFGLGKPTGFELPGENPGKLQPPSRWTSFSLPSICVGQEVCVTSLQMALGYGAIANDGVRMQPRLVRRVRRPDGTWAERPVRAAERVIPASVAQRVRKVLCAVVEEGTGKQARLPAYTIGGKTGTAQKPTVGGFSHSAVMCSFVGMAPIERPRLVVIVTADEPTKTAGGRHFGGTVAAPAVAQIIKRALAYLGVPPDKPQALERLGIATAPQKVTR